jgi:hypothetical protein
VRDAIQVGAQPEYVPALAPSGPPPPGSYSSWDDFRSTSPALQRALIDLATKVLPDLRGMKPRDIPADAPATDDELGCPIASMTLTDEGQSRGTFKIRRVLFGCLFGAAILLIAFLERYAMRTAAVTVGSSVGALAIAFWTASRYGPFKNMGWHGDLGHAFQSATLWLFEDGIFWQQGSQFGRWRWEDIELSTVSRQSRQPRYRIVPRHDTAMELSLACSPAIMALAEYMEVKIASAQLVPKLRRIVAGERVRFGVVLLDAQGFASPGFTAPWSDVVRVVADQTSVFVDRRDQPEWHPIPYRDVSCPLLLLALAQILIEDCGRLPPILGITDAQETLARTGPPCALGFEPSDSP